MKKYICLLLACVMALGLAACNNSDPSTPKEPNNTPSETFDDATWNLNVSTKDVSFTPFKGVDITGTIMVSPLTRERFNPSSTIMALEQLNYFKDWDFSYETIENAIPHFTENGQMTSYQFSDILTIRDINGEWGASRNFSVEYESNTETCINYESITITFEYFEGEGFLPEEQVCGVLKTVFGNDIGNFLYYNENSETPQFMHHHINCDGGTVLLSRSRRESMEVYSIESQSYGIEPIKGYPGEYQPNAQNLNIIYDFLHFAEGERDVLNVNNLGKTFFEKHFGPDTNITLYSTNIYTQCTRNGVNSSDDTQDESISIYFDITKLHENQDDHVSVNLFHNYKNSEDELSLIFSFPNVPSSEVTDEYKESVQNKVSEIVKDILKTDRVNGCFDKNKTYNIQIAGRDAYVQFKIEWFKSGDEQRALFIINASTNMST